METGIYQNIINTLFREKLKYVDEERFFIGKKKIGCEEAVLYLSHYLCDILQGVIESACRNNDDVDNCIAFINKVIKRIAAEFDVEEVKDDLIDKSATILTAIIDKTACDYPDVEEYLRSITPIKEFSKSALFTGYNQSLNLYSELKKEILSADEVCLLVSFIKMSGLNLLLPELKRMTEQGRRLRVITTTYTGASDFKAVRKLAMLSNTEVKISYKSDSDRLHAKAYLFLRNTGLNTAYIGSSNMSAPALTTGLEWNVKVTQMELPDMVDTVRNTFETYWNDDTFETYTPGEDDERLRYALGEIDEMPIDFSVLDLMKAKDFQEDILEKLDIERNVRGHYHNLVVAATGTGKTVIAAFDFKRFREAHPTAHFLFIAHREEIIKQAHDTFRMVLRDPNFGDLWYGGYEAKEYCNVFASKDLLNNRIDDLALPEDYYDYIVIDEAHHVVAESYQKILKKFKPKILLGLTATPERMDEQDITPYFDGRIAAQIRLTDALNAGLLSPFTYYGITDTVDLDDVRWENGHFVAAELSRIYTNNDNRTALIWNTLEKYLPNPRDVRALCFCVTQEHAAYMNAKFTLAGLKSAVLTAENTEDRVRLKRQLSEKTINYLFVVDMFNEGVDVPDIDTVLFLRPTESLTVFLQQFGRGLRKTATKERLTVFDFVGHTRSEFNYESRFRALMGRTSMSVKEEVEHGFPHLPMGCKIEIERKACDYILDNIDARIGRLRKNQILSAINHFHQNYTEPLSIESFTRLAQIPMERLYKIDCWSELKHMAGLWDCSSPLHNLLKAAVYKKWLSTDSYSYFLFIQHLAEKRFKVNAEQLTPMERKMGVMLYYDFYNEANQHDSLQSMFDVFASDDLFVDELQELLPILIDRCQVLEDDDNSTIRIVNPLKLHGIYTRGQIYAALGTSTLERKSPTREGVERNKNLNVEAMFVDIIKDREAGSTTNYNDYAVTSSLFHWETQNQVSPTSTVGKNYINETQTMLLFVRPQSEFPDDKYRTMGYVYLGEVTLEDWKGSHPMEINWRLKTPMPPSVFNYSAIYQAQAK